MFDLKRRFLAALLALSFVLVLAACSGDSSGYRRAGDLGGEELCAAFREGDWIRDVMVAGMMTLAADGTLAQLSLKWFGDEDAVYMPEDDSVSDWLENRPQRTFILGYYRGAKPLCFEENGAVTGFDAEMFAEICRRLGWEIRYQAIDHGTAEVELKSGNVDCVAGGYGTDDGADGLSLSPTYLDCDYEIVSLASSGINRKGELEGKTVGTVASSAMGAALEADTGLMENIGAVRAFFTEDDCFAALNSGMCDAVIVTSLYADYCIN